jgi:hypothetical protein
MERRIAKKVNDYVHNFKTDIVSKINENNDTYDEGVINNLINYIYQHNNFELCKEDFMKRKRVKNMVPIYERCCAKRANGQQCTRRKKDELLYCGTHSKGTPHGVVNDNETVPTVTKIEVSAIDIKGIVYYLDNNGNVYDTGDIISNEKNPRIIAKYEKNGEIYSIPSLFI